MCRSYRVPERRTRLSRRVPPRLRPHAAEPHRALPRRHGADDALQLALRPAQRRPGRAALRGHRRRALDRGGGAARRGRAALARDRLGRRALPADAALSPLPGRRRGADRKRRRLPLLLHRGGARGRPGAAPGRGPAARLQRPLPGPPGLRARGARGPGAAVGRAPGAARDRYDHDRGRRPRDGRVGERPAGRPRHPALRRLADLPVRKPVRRHPDGCHLRDPRRGSAALDATPARALPRARCARAEVRPPADGARAGQAQALASATARSRSRSSSTSA